MMFVWEEGLFTDVARTRLCNISYSIKVMSSLRLPLPKPLFDTLENIRERLPVCVSEYLNAVNIAEASKEFELTQEFLLSYSGSLDTYTAYRREVERILHWVWLVRRKSLKDLTRNDLRDYIEFSNSPPPTWIAEKTVSRFIDEGGVRCHNLAWRPYVVRISKSQRYEGKLPDKRQYQLSSQSIQALFSTLSTYFTYLQQENYLEVNPISLIRQKKRYIQKQQTQRVTRKLSRIQWLCVIETAESLADQLLENERILFLMSAFYLLGLRISEVSETLGRIPCMGDFAPDKYGLWWFTTVGKGNKVRDVAVPDAMLEALKRYRLSCGLSPLPVRGEQIPLLAKLRGRGGLGTRQIRNLVQKCFDQAVNRLRQAGKEDEAQDLTTATVHWLRHTAISADVEERPIADVRDDVGHTSAATTDRYIDVDRIARHQSAKRKKLR
jgi:site-specific recombinase XerD